MHAVELGLGWVELTVSAVLSIWLILAYVAYLIRTKRHGSYHSETVEQKSGSKVFAKWLIQGAYWNVQPMGRALLAIGVTPNMLTFSSLFLGLGAGISLSQGRFGLAAFFCVATGFADVLDGVLARMAGLTSRAGALLDSSVDRYVDFFILGGLAVHYRNNVVLLLLVLTALTGSFMISYSSSKNESLKQNPPRGSMRRSERHVLITLAIMASTFTVGGLEQPLEAAGGIYVGYPLLVMIGAIAVFANLSAVQRLVAIYRGVAREDRVSEA